MNNRTMDGVKSLRFRWKYKDIELRACPKQLAALDPNEPNTTIDLVKWFTSSSGKRLCYSLGYFVRGSEGYDFRFVGDRPFDDIKGKDIPVVWKALRLAQKCLDQYFKETED